MFNGFKTVFVALLMAVVPTLTTVVGGVDWTKVLAGWGVPDQWVVPVAGLVAGLVMAVMRFLTQVTTVKDALNTEPPK